MDLQEQGNIKDQRRRAVRTASVLAVIALLIFVAFILSGVLGSGNG